MKDIKEFLNEAKEFNPEDKLNAYNDNSAFLKYVASETGTEKSDFSISSDGVKYKKFPIEGTKINGSKTGEEMLEIIKDYLVKKKEIDAKIDKRTVVKKPRKNAGTPRGNYGAAERMAARAEERNQSILRGDWNPSAYEK